MRPIRAFFVVAALTLEAESLAAQTKSAPSRSAAPPLTAAKRDSLLWRRDELIARHVFEEDSIEGGGWFRHGSQPALYRFDHDYLRAAVNASGRTYLLSRFRGDSWIFHNQLVVRSGERVWRSGAVSPTSGAIDREVVSGGVLETVHFLASSDGGILAAIAASVPDQRFLVRQTGGPSHYNDFTLEERDRIAVAEGVELGRLIRQVGRTTKPRTPAPALIAHTSSKKYFRVSPACAPPTGPEGEDWFTTDSPASSVTLTFTKGSDAECLAALAESRADAAARALAEQRALAAARARDSLEAVDRRLRAELAARRDSINRAAGFRDSVTAAAREALRMELRARQDEARTGKPELHGYVAGNMATKTYHKIGCDDDRRVSPQDRELFSSWQWAEIAKYTRSQSRGC